MIINVIGKVHNSCDCLNLLNTITQVSTLRLFVTGIIKLCIVLISGSPCPDDGTPRKDAPEGEYTLTVRIVYLFFFLGQMILIENAQRHLQKHMLLKGEYYCNAQQMLDKQ